MSVRTAIFHTATAHVLALGLMAIGFAVLGRLLPPEAFGHFAIALAVFGLADIVVQFGLRQLVISRTEGHSRDEIATAAGLSLALAILSCAGILVAVAALGGTVIPAELAAALVPLALALLVGPFALAPEALLRRSLRFGLISVGAVLRVGADVTVAVGLALLGYGAVALAVGVLASRIAITLLLLAGGGAELRIVPRLRPALGAWRDHRGWGGRLTVIQVLPQISNLAILSGLSALQGPAALGFFNRARTIHDMLDKSLLEGIKPVILPALSAAVRRGVDARAIYRTKLDYLTALCWPAFALIALLADDLVAVLLGPGWDSAVPAVRILALMGLGLPATKMSQKFFIALDRTGAFLRIEAVREGVRIPLALAGAMVSLPWFVFAFVLGSWIKAVGITRYLHRELGGPEGGYRPIAARGAGLTLAALAGPALVIAVDLSAVATLATALPLAGLGWLLAAFATRHPIADEFAGAMRGVLDRLRRRGEATAGAPPSADG